MFFVAVKLFIGKNWRLFAGLGAAIALYFAYEHMRHSFINEGKDQQVQIDDAKYTAAVKAANKSVENDNSKMQFMSAALDKVVVQRQAALDITVTPQIKRIQDEVSTAPQYSKCVVSDSVRSDENAERASVDASIGATNPK